MTAKALIQVRVDESLKKEADTLFADLGFDTPTAVRIFLRQAIKRRGMPFDVAEPAPVPSAETIDAMEEADPISENPQFNSFQNFSAFLDEVLHDQCT